MEDVSESCLTIRKSIDTLVCECLCGQSEQISVRQVTTTLVCVPLI